MSKYSWILLLCLHMQGVAMQTVQLIVLDDVLRDQDMHLKCESSESNLLYTDWFVEMPNVEYIYRYDHIGNTGTPFGDYINRTDSMIVGQITLIIHDALFDDDGLYYCTIHPIIGSAVESDRVAINVSVESFPEAEQQYTGECSINITCWSEEARPAAVIEWEYEHMDQTTQHDTITCHDSIENYCSVNSTLVISNPSGQTAECWVHQGLPLNRNESVSSTIVLACPGCCCLEWWIGLLSVCVIIAAWIVIIFVGVCILHEKVTRLTFWLFILISNIILVIIGLCVVIPMYNERENSCAKNCECCYCCGCSELWLCPLITSVILIVLDVCIGVCICMNKPRRQEEFMQIQDDKTLKLNYHHSTFGLSYLSLLKGDTELAGCDISDKTWKSSNPLATCTRTPKGHEWIIKVASAGDAGLYTCIAYIRLCRVSVASKRTEVTVKFNETNEQQQQPQRLPDDLLSEQKM